VLSPMQATFVMFSVILFVRCFDAKIKNFAAAANLAECRSARNISGRRTLWIGLRDQMILAPDRFREKRFDLGEDEVAAAQR
jgi:hypothetical protein